MLESAISNRAIKLGIHKIRSIIDQQYVGDINILPDPTLANFLHIGSNPSKQSLDELFKHGERTTWPQIDLIERNTIISTTLRKYLKLLKEREALILGRHHELKVVNS
jgi:TAG lipase/steryl ester hydrolase/phospholipase A2/LPA acyltransferase